MYFYFLTVLTTLLMIHFMIILTILRWRRKGQAARFRAWAACKQPSSPALPPSSMLTAGWCVTSSKNLKKSSSNQSVCKPIEMFPGCQTSDWDNSCLCSSHTRLHGLTSLISSFSHLTQSLISGHLNLIIFSSDPDLRWVSSTSTHRRTGWSCGSRPAPSPAKTRSGWTQTTRRTSGTKVQLLRWLSLKRKENILSKFQEGFHKLTCLISFAIWCSKLNSFNWSFLFRGPMC